MEKIKLATTIFIIKTFRDGIDRRKDDNHPKKSAPSGDIVDRFKRKIADINGREKIQNYTAKGVFITKF